MAADWLSSPAIREAMRLYDTSTWLETITLEGVGGGLWPTIISPDGNVIGAAPVTGGGPLQLWRASSLAEIEESEARRNSAIKLPEETHSFRAGGIYDGPGATLAPRSINFFMTRA